jgi:phosphate transport system permease protein
MLKKVIMSKRPSYLANRKPLPAWFVHLRRKLNYGDRIWNGLTIAMALITILLVLAIGLLLWRDSASARSMFGLGFLKPTLNSSWNPVAGKFHAWPFIYGTLLTSLVALIVAIPVSLGVAIFLAELSPAWLRVPLGWMVELLAAIPSVVYGLWGIFVFLPKVVAPVGNFLGNTLGNIPGLSLVFSGPIPTSGSSRLAAAFILSIMIIPTITAVTRDVFLAIPRSQREASLALGATQWETISKILLPYGLSGILGAVILGLGRALGETMAVTMVIGNSIEGSPSLLRPGYTMSSIIANEFAEAVSPIHTGALVEIALVLFGLTLLLNIGARFLVWRVSRRNPQETRA